MFTTASPTVNTPIIPLDSVTDSGVEPAMSAEQAPESPDCDMEQDPCHGTETSTPPLGVGEEESAIDREETESASGVVEPPPVVPSPDASVTTSPLSVDELECSLCLRILCAPVTTTCGHTFCRDCLHHASTTAHHHAKCPMCRSVLPISGSVETLSINLLLDRVIQACFPAEHAARWAEEKADQAAAAAAASIGNGDDTTTLGDPSRSLEESPLVPLFELDATLPGQQIQLRVYEPRYLRMIERCLSGSRRFGMVGSRRWNHHHGHAPVATQFGTEVEIVDLEHLSPNLMHVTAVGRRIFRIQERVDTSEGYLLARVEWLQLGDDHVDPVEPGHLLESRALGESVTSWITLVREGGWERVDGQLDWILSELGTMPPENRCNARALWVAALINPHPAMGVAPEIRPAMLEADSTETRLGVASRGVVASLSHMTPSQGNRMIARALDTVGIGSVSPRTLRMAWSICTSPWVFILLAICIKLVLYPDQVVLGDGQIEAGAAAATVAVSTAGDTPDPPVPLV